MKKTIFHLINIMLAVSIYAAPVIPLDKALFNLTPEACKAISKLVLESNLESKTKDYLVRVIVSQRINPAGKLTAVGFLAEIMNALEQQREKLSSEEGYLSLIKIKEDRYFDMDTQPFMLKGTPHEAAMGEYYKSESKTIQAMAELSLGDAKKGTITQFDSESAFFAVHIPGEYFRFHQRPPAGDQLLRVVTLDEEQDCIRPKWYIIHDNRSVETQHNSLVLSKNTPFMDEDKRIYDNPYGYTYLVSGTEHIPTGMLPNALNLIANIDALTCIKEEIKNDLKSADIVKLLGGQIDASLQKIIEEAAFDALDTNPIDLISDRLATLFYSEPPLEKLSGLGKLLNVSKLRNFTQQCKADQRRYAFIKSLFEPLIEKNPMAKTLVITLPSTPLENYLLFIACLEKQRALLHAHETELIQEIDSEIAAVEEAAMQLICTSDWGITTRAELEKQWEAGRACVVAGSTQGKNARKKAAKKQSPAEIKAKNILLKQQDQQLAFKGALQQELKRHKEGFADKFKPLVKSVQRICQNYDLTFQQNFGKGDHLKLKFDSGAVVLPTHDRGKGLCHKIIRQLENVLLESFGSRN